ncbi:MAG: hypothetical protein ACXVXP_00080 [Mycobacteriaceae bacterium]
MPSTPQDHKKKAAKAEATGEPITFTFDDVDYSIARESADNLELFEFIEDEKYISAIRGFLGNDQWSRFKESQRDDAGRVSAERFEEFLNGLMAAISGN